MSNVLVDAPIVPGAELGGIALLSNIGAVRDPIFDRSFPNDQLFHFVTPYQVTYLLADGRVRAYVDVRDGSITRLAALQGYGGSLPGGVRVGMTVDEVIARDSGYYFDEAQGMVIHQTFVGVDLELEDPDPPLDRVSKMAVLAVCVWKLSNPPSGPASGQGYDRARE